MYMDGFLGWSDPNGPCVAFLHRDLILRSPGLLFAAFFATVAAGVAVEGLAAARRWRAKTQDAACLDAIAVGGNPVAVSMALKTQALLLYGTQCSAGYLLMLVSMTYHAVLFLGVVLGLVLGHACFNAAAPLGARRRQRVLPARGGGVGARRGRAGPHLASGGRAPGRRLLGVRGSVDDHSSLDSLNKDLIARRGSGRRGGDGERTQVGPGSGVIELIGKTSRVLRTRVSPPTHASWPRYHGERLVHRVRDAPAPYVPERLAEPRALVLAEPGLQTRGDHLHLGGVFRGGKRRQHADGAVQREHRLAVLALALLRRRLEQVTAQPRRHGRGDQSRPALPGFTPTSSLSPDRNVRGSPTAPWRSSARTRRAQTPRRLCRCPSRRWRA